jgi:hypothetical protein
MRPDVGWICVDGIELAYDARVLSYLHLGLAGAALSTGIAVRASGEVTGYEETPYEREYGDGYYSIVTASCAGVETIFTEDPYSDTFVDNYGTGVPVVGFLGACLECACNTLTFDEVFVDPAVDDAPWYQASSPASAEFLGVLVTNVELPPPMQRAQTPRARFGGTPSAQRLLPRLLQAQVQLYAATGRGMEWGKRWLSDVLAGACAGSDVTILPYCPADGEDADAVYRVLADAVLIDGPVFADAGVFQGFRMCTASFQLAATSPWLLGLPVECEHATLPPGASTSCLVETDDWGGGKAVTVRAAGSINGVRVTATPLTSDQSCPLPGGMPCSEFVISGTQRGDVLTVDTGRHTALLTDTSSKLDVSAVPYMDFVGPMPWIDAPACTRLCVTVTNQGTGTADVTIETVVREL